MTWIFRNLVSCFTTCGFAFLLLFLGCMYGIMVPLVIAIIYCIPKVALYKAISQKTSKWLNRD